MARLFNGTSDEINATTPILTGYPLAVSAWARIDTTTNGSYFVSGALDNSGANFLVIYIQRVSAGGGSYRGAAEVKDSGAQDASATGNLSINQTWAHIFGYFASTTSRTIYVDGVAGTENTTSVNPAGISQHDIGHALSTGRFPGRIAELAWYDATTFTTSDITALANGASPLLVHPAGLAQYYPLVGRHSPEIELIAGADGTLTGTSAAEHPRIMYSPHSRLGYVGSAAPTTPHGPLGHPLWGPLAGPVGA